MSLSLTLSSKSPSTPCYLVPTRSRTMGASLFVAGAAAAVAGALEADKVVTCCCWSRRSVDFGSDWLELEEARTQRNMDCLIAKGRSEDLERSKRKYLISLVFKEWRSTF